MSVAHVAYCSTEFHQYGSGHSSLGFTGEYIDQTGLQYLRARYYDSTIGIFISRDSI